MKTLTLVITLTILVNFSALCQQIKVTKQEPTIVKIDVYQWQSKTRCDTNPNIKLNLVLEGIDLYGLPKSHTLEYQAGKPITLPLNYENMSIKVYPKEKNSGLKPQQFFIKENEKRAVFVMEQAFTEE